MTKIRANQTQKHDIYGAFYNFILSSQHYI